MSGVASGDGRHSNEEAQRPSLRVKESREEIRRQADRGDAGRRPVPATVTTRFARIERQER